MYTFPFLMERNGSMASKNKYIASIVLDGEKQFKSAVAECNRKLTMMRSEMNLTKETFAGSANTLNALNAKYSILEKTMQAQNQKIKAIRDGMNHANQEYMRVGTNLDKLRKEHEQASKALDEMRKSSDATEEQLKQQETEVDKLSRAITLGEESYKKAGRNVEDWNKKLYTAQAQEKKNARELANYKKYIDEAKKSVDGCAVSIDRYGKKSKETETAVKEGVNALAGAMAAQGIGGKVEELAEQLYDYTKAADEFSVASAKLSTIADTEKVSMDKLNEQLMSISGETGEAVSGLSESAYQAISAGTDTSRAAEVVSTATKSSIAGFTDTATAIDGLTTIVNSYGDKVKDATEVSDIFLTVQNLGKTSFGELSASIGKVATNASNYNVSVQDLGTAYIQLTKRGIQTSEATTYTNSMLKELGKSSSNLSQILKKKTGKSFAELMESGKSLGDVLGIIYDSVGQDNTAFINLFSSQEAATGAVTMLKGGTEEYNNTLAQVRKSAGATETAYQKMTNTSEFAKKKIANSAQNIKIAIGTQLNEALEGVIGKFSNMSEWASEYVKENPKVVSAIAAFTASLVALTGIISGYTIATRVIIPLIRDFNAALAGNPAGLAAVAISTLVAGLMTFVAMQKSANKETDKEILKMEESRKALKEKDKTIRESIQAADEQIQNTKEEIAGTESLVSRLINLNSVEKKSAGQKAEIKAIVDKLKNSIPEIAKAYDKESGSVDLTTKEIKKLTEAYKEQAIVEGMQKQIQQKADAAAEAELNYAAAQEAAAESINKKKEAEKTYNAAKNKWDAAQKEQQKTGYNDTEKMSKLADAYYQAERKLDKLKKQESLDKETAEKLKKTRDSSKKSLQDVTNYTTNYRKELSKEEKSEKKAASGTKKVADQYDKVSSAFSHAQKSIVSSGYKMTAGTKKNFEAMVKLAKKTGTDIPKGLAQKLKNGAKDPQKATKDIEKAVEDNLLKMAENARKAGVYVPQSLTDGIKNGSISASDAYGEIDRLLKKQGNKQQKTAKKLGLNISTSTAKAIEKGGPQCLSAIKTLDKSMKELMEACGVHSADGILKGLQERTPQVLDGYSKLGSKIDKEFRNSLKIQSPSRVFAESGRYTVMGVISGVDALSGQLQKKYKELGGITDSAYREALEIHSPSKKMKKNGEYSIKGVAEGIKSGTKDAEEATKKAAEKVRKKAEEERRKATKRQNQIVKKAENKVSTKNLKEKEIVDTWKKVVNATKKGTDAHVKALKKYKSAKEKLQKEEKNYQKDFKKNYQDLMKDLKSAISDYKSQIQDLQNTYKEAVSNTQESIGGSWGMFSKAETSKTNNAAGLIRNMKSQADTVIAYQKNMDKLRKSGLSSAIIKELESAGISSAGDVETLASMNKAQLAEYQKYYNQREAYAKKESLAVNKQLQSSTNTQVANLKKKMVNLEKTYSKKITKLEKKYKKQMKSLGVNVSNGFAKGIEKGSNNVYKAIAKMTGQTVKQVKKNLGIHSPSRVFAEMGGYTGLGFAQGLDRETKDLSKIILGNLPDSVKVPTATKTDTAIVSSASKNDLVQLNLYMNSDVVAAATFKKIDMMQGADIRLKKRGLVV